MAVSLERSCTLLVNSEKSGTIQEVRKQLEGSEAEAKISAMKKTILLLLQGENVQPLFFTIVKYVLPTENHVVQKLLLLYLEMIQKTDANGKLLTEMILICQTLRNNLNHPNEYIKGCTLRFLCKISEEDLLDPLIPSILANLDHRHSYVRRNAVMAISEIYKLPKGEQMLHDASELIEKLLMSEQDLSTQRNAFKFLCQHEQERAISYLLGQGDGVAQWGDIMQLTALDLIRKVCRQNPAEKGRFLKVILALLNSNSHAVMYECALALTQLSGVPSAIKAAINSFCQLLVSVSDNNVKLIVLDRLQELLNKHKAILQESVMDIMRALNSPALDIKTKTLDIALQLITQQNIDEVVTVLKRELLKTQSKEYEFALEYRQLLVQSIHSCSSKYPQVVGEVMHYLIDFLYDPQSVQSALEISYFVREMMESNPQLRPQVLERLIDAFPQIRSGKVLPPVMWILGEYAESKSTITKLFQMFKESVGKLPLKSEDDEANMVDSKEAENSPIISVGMARPAVLADGTYATQTAVQEQSIQQKDYKLGTDILNQPNVRAQILEGNYYVASIMAATVAKLLTKYRRLKDMSQENINKQSAEAMLILVGILRSGKSGEKLQSVDSDSYNRITQCIVMIAKPSAEQEDIFLHQTRQTFIDFLKDKQKSTMEEEQKNKQFDITQCDDTIDFQQLKANKGLSQLEMEDEIATDLAQATGFAQGMESGNIKQQKILQLTGLSDTIYAEAVVTTHQYDIVLDITITNQTQTTLQNVTIELQTMGDLRLVERPQTQALSPMASKNLRANIKVSSTETGVVFGNITYDSTGHSDRQVVVLNNIHIDIMDYINPADCSDNQFKTMWQDFEWENKVSVNTNIEDLLNYLQHVASSTNMKCLTSQSQLRGECAFLTANLYARSVFGEDALVNVSIEKQGDGRLSGFIRIRSKTQGIALSLGEEITLKQKLLL